MDGRAVYAPPIPSVQCGSGSRRVVSTEPKDRVRVLDIATGSLGITDGRHLDGAELRGELGSGSGFGQIAEEHGSARGNVERLGGSPACLVGAGLTTSDDLLEHGASLVRWNGPRGN